MNFWKWLKYSLITLGILTLVSMYLFHRTGLQIYGALTEKVDHNQFKPTTGAIAISNVNVLSSDGESFLEDQTVMINNGKIQSINSKSGISEKVTKIDGSGKYLIPGLIDAHVHLFKSPNDLLLYIANGVTEVRELIGEPDHLKWRKEIENGRIGPRMFVATPRLGSFESMEGWFMETTQGFLNVKNAEEAEKMIKSLHQQGYDGVKIYSQLNKESYDAIMKTAASLDMPTFGHIPWSIGLEDLYKSGQSGIAHFEEIMNALNRELGEKEFGNFYGNEEAFLAYVEERSEDIAQNLIKNNIPVTSTLWLTQTFARQKFDLDQLLKEVELEYQNPGISEWNKFIPGGLGWLPEVNRFKLAEGLIEERLKSHKKYWTAYGEACKILASKLNEKGVKIMAGTDTNLPPTVPGFSLHDELISLSEAGMTPAQALRSATTTPANWLKRKSGKIASGYDANMILLDKNPLEDISNTKAINTVISQGRVFNSELLGQILASVKEANDRSRKVDISHYITDKVNPLLSEHVD